MPGSRSSPASGNTWIPLAMDLAERDVSAIGLIALALVPGDDAHRAGIHTRASYLDVARTLGRPPYLISLRPSAMPKSSSVFLWLDASF